MITTIIVALDLLSESSQPADDEWVTNDYHTRLT